MNDRPQVLGFRDGGERRGMEGFFFFFNFITLYHICMPLEIWTSGPDNKQDTGGFNFRCFDKGC